MSGSFAIEDDGVALRQLPWAQYKKHIQRWFYWESTYYNNFQGGTGESNVFKDAHTFGGLGGRDEIIGETGPNYTNGDGVLFYPGTDRVFPAESYGLDGPIASLRLKHWRRGIQDVDYLALAHKVAPAKAGAILQRLVLNKAHPTEIDPDGRLVLPATLRGRLTLEGEAYFAGMGETFEIWKPETFAVVDAARMEKLLAEMGEDFDPLSLLGDVEVVLVRGARERVELSETDMHEQIVVIDAGLVQ